MAAAVLLQVIKVQEQAEQVAAEMVLRLESEVLEPLTGVAAVAAVRLMELSKVAALVVRVL